jgi:hypothetical protein
VTARDRLIYASHQQGLYRVTLEPPDAPVRPSVECETRAEVDAFAKRRRARIVWWPPLSKTANQRA